MGEKIHICLLGSSCPIIYLPCVLGTAKIYISISSLFVKKYICLVGSICPRGSTGTNELSGYFSSFSYREHLVIQVFWKMNRFIDNTEIIWRFKLLHVKDCPFFERLLTMRDIIICRKVNGDDILGYNEIWWMVGLWGQPFLIILFFSFIHLLCVPSLCEFIRYRKRVLAIISYIS